MALKDIISNSALADDMVISLPNNGGTMTLGEIRSQTADERRALLTRQQSLEAAEAGVMTRVQKLREAGLLDDQFNPVTPTRSSERDFRQTVSEVTGVSESDPLFGPVLKAAKEEVAKVIKAELDPLKTQLASVAGATRQAIGGYLNDRYSAEFARSVAALPEPVRTKMKYEDAYKFADERKILDSEGRYDIAAAVDRLSWNDVKEYERGLVQKDAAKLAEEKKTLAQMNRPGINGPRVAKPVEGDFNPLNEKGKVKSIDEALAAAAQDDEIWASAAKFVN